MYRVYEAWECKSTSHPDWDSAWTYATNTWHWMDDKHEPSYKDECEKLGRTCLLQNVEATVCSEIVIFDDTRHKASSDGLLLEEW
jgi:hypothetical protein